MGYWRVVKEVGKAVEHLAVAFAVVEVADEITPCYDVASYIYM